MEQVVKLANAWASALTAVEKGTRDHEANQTLVFFLSVAHETDGQVCQLIQRSRPLEGDERRISRMTSYV